MNVKEQAAREVLHHVYPDAPGGIPAGGFITALLNAWGRADGNNSTKLGRAFPAYWPPLAVAQTGGRQELLDLIDDLAKAGE